MGGVDNNGTHLYSIYPHGSIDKLPYISMGSGSMAAISELESRWNENLTVTKFFLNLLLNILVSLNSLLGRRRRETGMRCYFRWCI